MRIKIGILLLFLGLISCTEKDTTLTIWETGWEEEREFLEYAIKEFQKEYTDITISIETFQLGNITQRVLQDIPAGVGPDIFAVPHDQIGQLIDAGLIMENLVSADEIRSEFHPVAVAAVSKGDKIYGFPVNMETYALFYNKNYFDSDPITFENLIIQGEKITDKKQNIYTLVWPIAELYYYHAFMAMNGGYIFGKNATDPNDLGLNNEGSIKGLENMLKLKPISIDNATDATTDVMYGFFGEDKAAAIITGPWSIKNIKQTGIPFGIAPLPTFEGNRPVSLAGVITYQVSSFSKDAETAQLFAKFLSSPEMLLERFKYTSHIPPHKKLLEDPLIKENENIAPFLIQLESSVPMPFISEMGVVWAPTHATISDVWDGKISVVEGLNNLAKTVSSQIKTLE